MHQLSLEICANVAKKCLILGIILANSNQLFILKYFTFTVQEAQNTSYLSKIKIKPCIYLNVLQIIVIFLMTHIKTA